MHRLRRFEQSPPNGDAALWITSFLYGLLRPLDMIHPYRMEGKVELDGKTMFQHWKPLLTDVLIESVKAD